MLTIAIVNSHIKETNSSQHLDTIVFLLSLSDHHSNTLNILTNRTNRSKRLGQIINHLDLILVTQGLLFTPVMVVIKNQRLTISMNPTTNLLDSNHFQHRRHQRSVNTNLDQRKNSIKISQDSPISINLENTSKNTNLELITDPNFLLPLCLQNITLSNQNLRIRY